MGRFLKGVSYGPTLLPLTPPGFQTAPLTLCVIPRLPSLLGAP